MCKVITQRLVISGELPSRNQAESAARKHWSSGSRFKRENTELVQWFVKIGRIKPVKGLAAVTVTFFEKNKKRDADNIMAGGLKYIMDGLVTAGILQDDSPKYVDLTVSPIKYDGLNPRIEVVLVGEVGG